MKKIAVVLTGCGHRDGSEITEAVSTLIALSQHGAEYQVFAPSQEFTVIDHLTGETTSFQRNVLQESARIARGNVKDLNELNEQDFDGLVFPGGYGAALTLTDWAQKGSQAIVLPAAENVVRSFYKAGKPIVAICIAPTLLAKVLGSEGITLTIGSDKETAQEIEKTGAQHENCAVIDFITDRGHKVISTPAYMYGQSKPHEVFDGISKAIKELVEMA